MTETAAYGPGARLVNSNHALSGRWQQDRQLDGDPSSPRKREST